VSTPLEILSFDGYVFADHDWYAGQPLETSRGQYGVDQNVTSRSGNTSIVSRGPISPRRITVDITLNENSTLGLLEAIDELAGNLDPRNQNARTLVANRNGVTVQCQARIQVPNGFSGSGAINVIRVVFVSEQPEWIAQTATTVTQSGSVSPFSAAVANAGQAVVRPIYRIGWSALDSMNDAFPANVSSWAEEFNHASATVTWSWDSGAYHTAVGSAMANVSANTVTGAVISNFVNQGRMDVIPGQYVWVNYWTRTDDVDLQPYVTVAWYDSAGAYLSGNDQTVGALSAATWHEQWFQATAPASAAFATIAFNVYSVTTGNTGNVRFDDLVSQVYRAGGAIVGQRYRRRDTKTNNQDRTLAPFPYMIDLEDTAALVSGSKAQADGDDVRVIIDGEDITRQLGGFNLTKSHVWVVFPGADSGETVNVDVIYGNASATNPPTWTDPDPDKPVVDIYSESGTATGGSTSTIVKASATWDTNRWKNGRARILTGAAAGDTQVILSNTATTITLNGFVSAAVGAGDTFLLLASDNTRWAWGVRQTDRETDYARGRWYVNSPRLTPSVVSYESPGAWRPELVLDNRDSMGQKRFSMIDVGGDRDPYTILDAQRMWEGNDGNVYNAGTADGVSITLPAPIYGLYWAYQFDNPNAMVKAWIGVRGSGAEDWAEAWTNEAATSGLATFTPSLIAISDTFGTEIYQIAQAILPIDDIEIDLTWKRDTGSLSSATTTVSTDSSAEWATDQFDNGKIRMLSGVNAGKVRSITSNTSTAITHSAFPSASGDGDRYLVYNSRLKGRLLDDATLSITFYEAPLSGGIGTETEVYELSCTLWVGAGPSGDPAGQHRALIGYAAGSKRLFLTDDEQLVIDSDLRKIRIYNTATEAYTQTLTDPMVIIQWHNGTDWVRSADWLPLGMNVNSLTNPTALTNTTGWTHSFTHASVTAAFDRDSSVYHDAAGSFKFTVSANTAGGPDVVILGAYSDKITCSVGDTVSVSGWVRTTHASLDPALGIDWYTSGDVYISSSSSADIGLAADTWSSLAVSGIAPATAAKYSAVLVVRSDANQTGTIYFDDLHANEGEGLVWLEETNMGTLDLEVEYAAAYLGA